MSTELRKLVRSYVAVLRTEAETARRRLIHKGGGARRDDGHALAHPSARLLPRDGRALARLPLGLARWTAAAACLATASEAPVSRMLRYRRTLRDPAATCSSPAQTEVDATVKVALHLPKDGAGSPAAVCQHGCSGGRVPLIAGQPVCRPACGTSWANSEPSVPATACAPAACKCHVGFAGATCGTVPNICIANCGGHGRCAADGSRCDSGFAGRDCSSVLRRRAASRAARRTACGPHGGCICEPGCGRRVDRVGAPAAPPASPQLWHLIHNGASSSSEPSHAGGAPSSASRVRRPASRCSPPWRWPMPAS